MGALSWAFKNVRWGPNDTCRVHWLGAPRDMLTDCKGQPMGNAECDTARRCRSTLFLAMCGLAGTFAIALVVVSTSHQIRYPSALASLWLCRRPPSPEECHTQRAARG
ncbi:hypothetical protein GH5_08028 [Leishmania sp. Ghana 2012 LV757]|uniref:hypothetical protein n=1 Tax=Leishmania sp. Ghana 2012 LV757 TaxID=2803181 RepID=UPI001B6B71DF|nr:hypothetical protein GH5_08028 [Leishmania sp. Ghana 2012 LV757]